MENEQKPTEKKKETFIPFYDEVIKMDLTFSSKLLYCLIISLSKNNDNVCTASNKYLMERCNFSKKTLERSLEELNENNLFSKRNLIFKKIDEKRKRLQKREISVKEIGQTDAVSSDLNNEFGQTDGADLDKLTPYVGQIDGDLYNNINNNTNNNINNNSENQKQEEEMKLEKREIEEYIEKGVDIIIPNEQRLSLEDYESIMNSESLGFVKKQIEKIDEKYAWNLIKNEKGVEIKYLKEIYFKIWDIEKEIEKWSKNKYESYIKQKNEKKTNIYWIKSKNYLIKDLNMNLKRFNDNILNKESSKTENRYSITKFENEIIKEKESVTEKVILLTEEEKQQEYNTSMINVNAHLIDKCTKEDIDFKSNWLKIKHTIDWYSIKEEFLKILYLKDKDRQRVEKIKYEIELADVLFDSIKLMYEQEKKENELEADKTLIY